MFTFFSESLGLTAQQKEGIGELIALWIFAIIILTAFIMVIRYRKNSSRHKAHPPKHNIPSATRKKNIIS